jgi:hypothetical protein
MGGTMGPGLKVRLVLTDGATSISFQEQADPPLTSLPAACGACSDDNTVGCETDAECAGLGLGTCGRGFPGASRRPNACDDFVCEPVVGSSGVRGVCDGEFETFCDGFVRQNGGGGVLPCGFDEDCSSLDNDCPAADCGTCTLQQPRRCFLDPIVETGTKGVDGAELVSTFCAPPTVNVGINNTNGLPGAGRVKLDVDFTAYCPDGATPFELGGANCP